MIDNLDDVLAHALRGYGLIDPRTIQSQEGRIGPSDLGFCRQKAALMTRGFEQSDAAPILAAQMGTAIHRYAKDALSHYYPDWIVDSRRITATFPSGARVSGTPDIIIPEFNTVIDIKTVDGLAMILRNGPSQNHLYQRHTYALAAIQEGILDDEGVWVGNYYIDRAGKEEPLLKLEPFNPLLTDQVDQWITDVTYAVEHSEDASRDVVAPVCERICEYFTTCRGALPVIEGSEWIDDDERVDAIRMYEEAKAAEKRAFADKEAARDLLTGTNGVGDVDGRRMQVRWVQVNPSSYNVEKAAHQRMDLREVKA